MNETPTIEAPPTFAATVRKWRGEHTQEQAARAFGVPLQTWCAWEQGRTSPKGYVRQLVLRTLSQSSINQA